MSTDTSKMSLDATKIREHVARFNEEEKQLFTWVIREVKDRGTAISDAVISSLAKKIADKARQLAGDGESS
jgi:hypothetical protein